MRRIVVFLACLALPAASAAEQLVFGLDADSGWTKNLSFETSNEQDSPSYRLSPWLEFGRSRGDLTYGLNYRLTWEDYFSRSDADTVDQLLGLRGSYRLSETTQFSFKEQFSRQQALSQRFEDVDPDTEDTPDLENRRRRFIRNVASFGVTHSLSRRWTLGGNLSHTLVDFRDEGSVDSNSVTGGGNLFYTLSERDGVGFGFGVTHQEFDETDQRPASEADYLQVFGSWNHRFSPTFSMSLQAGPSWIRTESDGGLGSQTRFTYAGQGSLTKRWETADASLRYSRTESTGSGFAGATVADTISANLGWEPAKLWTINFSASWSRRESATEQVALERLEDPSLPPNVIVVVPRLIDESDSVDQWNVSMRIQRRLSKHLSTFAQLGWVRQERNVDSFTSTNQETDRLRIFVGLRWNSKPFLF